MFPILVGLAEGACPLFTASSLPADSTWYDIDYGAGYFVATGFFTATSNPTVVYSDDGGATWTAGVGASTTQDSFTNICRLGSTWLTVAINDFGGRKRYQKSTDAVNWTEGAITGTPSAPAANGVPPWTGLIAEPVQSKFVLLSNANTSANVFYTSLDGVDWATINNLFPSSERWWSIAASPTHMVAVSVNPDSSDSNKAAYSPIATYHNVLWTASTLPSTGSWRNVIWTGTCFFATTRFTTAAARSYDGGATWEAVTLPAGMNTNPIFANTTTGKLFLFLADYVTTPDEYYTSTDDGTTWTQCTSLNNAWTFGATSGTNHVIISGASFTNDAAYHL